MRVPTRIAWLMRKNQRGFFTLPAWALGLPWLKIAQGIAIGLALWAGYQWVDNSWETDAGIARGKRETVEEYRARDTAAREKYQKDKAALEAKNAKLEAELAGKNTQIGAEYQKGLADGKQEQIDASRRIAARGGLRDPGTRPSPRSDCPAMPATGSRGPRVDGPSRAELSPPDRGVLLSPEATQFLVGLGGEADDAIKQLRGAQDALEACYAAMDKAATGNPR